MARTIHRLNAAHVTHMTAAGMHPDGAGLYLNVSRSGAKSWIYRFTFRGRTREMGLGPIHLISLREARQKAHECRRQRYDGIDPIDARRTARLPASRPRTITFKAAAEAFLAAHQPGWKNPKHRAQWRSTLARFADPVIGPMPVDRVDTDAVLKIVEPLWGEKNETANRIRMRIEAILDWASARGHRDGNNPARWRGHLDKLLPPRTRIARPVHHPALPYGEVTSFVERLRPQGGSSAKAMGFLILTASRTGEVLGAQWSEIDFAKATWTIPAKRMKMQREHRVPLSAPALEILEHQRRLTGPGGYIFPGAKRGRPLSDMALLVLLRRMDCAHVTPHGFRSTFRDWVAEQTNVAGEVAEAALAHSVPSAVEAAYRRTDLFLKRVALMDTWGLYCGSAIQR